MRIFHINKLIVKDLNNTNCVSYDLEMRVIQQKILFMFTRYPRECFKRVDCQPCYVRSVKCVTASYDMIWDLLCSG